MNTSLERLTRKKVPAILVAFLAMIAIVAVVYATSIQATQSTYTGEGATYHNNTGAFTVTDNGLAVAANSGSAGSFNGTQIGASGDQPFNANAVTAGHWLESISFSTSLTDSSYHKIGIVIRNGTGTVGSTLATIGPSTSTFIRAPSSTSSATITLYVDLGGTSITSPVTVYVTVT